MHKLASCLAHYKASSWNRQGQGSQEIRDSVLCSVIAYYIWLAIGSDDCMCMNNLREATRICTRKVHVVRMLIIVCMR